jgi:hypothetical protein
MLAGVRFLLLPPWAYWNRGSMHSILGSTPKGPLHALVVKWHNTVLVRLNFKFDSWLEHQSILNCLKNT